MEKNKGKSNEDICNLLTILIEKSSKVDNKLDKLDIIDPLCVRVCNVEEKADKTEKALYGNGKPGLITEIEILKNNNCNKKDTSKIFLAGIVGAGFSFIFGIFKNLLER